MSGKIKEEMKELKLVGRSETERCGRISGEDGREETEAGMEGE